MNSDKNIRIKDIAEMAGVSVGTVDRVLHNRGNVSIEAKQKVKKILEKTSYTPDPIARSLSSKKDHEIVAIMPHPEQDEYWALSEAGIDEARQEWSPYNITIRTETFDLNNTDSFARVARNILAIEPDGVLTGHVYFEESLKFFQDLQAANIPYILFNTQIDKQVQKYNPLCFIGQNLYQSGRLAAELMHLTMKKPERLAIMHIHEYIDNAMHLKEKERGFMAYFEEMADWDYKIQSLLILDTEESVESQIGSYVQQDELEGIFVPTSSGTFATAHVMKKNHREDISLIGYDLLEQNIHFLESGTINFLINQNPRYQARQGIRHLANYLLLNTKIPSSDLLPLEIITRQNYRTYLEQKNIPQIQ